MNEYQMMDMIGEAREDYVQSAMETRGRRKSRRSALSYLSKVAVAAAIMMSLATVAYASDFLGIKTLASGGPDKTYSSFEKMDKAMKETGFQIKMKEEFESGYAFEKADVHTVKGLDEHREVKLTYAEISVELKNAAGHSLHFWANEDLEALKEMSQKENADQQVRQIGGIPVLYKVDTYRYLPAEREGSLTEEEKRWEQQPGHCISYFSWEGEAFEDKTAFLCWEQDGISYRFMDQDADESPDVLFSMAGELIGG